MNEPEAIENQFEDLVRNLEGRILPKRYRLDKLLSVNPYTALYRTVYEPEERYVTARVFRCLVRSQEDYQFKRFKQEVKKLSSLRHPNIAQVLDLGLLDEGLPYYILENLVGPTLEEVLVHQNRLEADQVVMIFSQVARAVQAAHDHGLMHETLQPSRIIISETESGDAIVRTTGFSLLSLHNKLGVALKTPMSRCKFMGTAAYMSPEQCYEGAEVDGRSDIYSIGCMIYECLSGQVPFMGTPQQVMQMQLDNEPTPISQVRKDLVIPRRLLAVMNKCLVKDPTRRYQFVRDLQTDLEQDLDPSERDKATVIPEAIQKAELRVKESKTSPIKLMGLIFGGIVALIVVLYVGAYIASMTSKLADNATWQSKLDAGKQAMSEARIEDARTSLESALTEAQKFPPPDDRLALTETEVGALYVLTGRYSTALENLREALSIEEQSRKISPETNSRTFELLSQAELASGRYKESEEHAAAAVKAAESISGQKTMSLYRAYLQQLKVYLAGNKMTEARVALDKIKATIGSTEIILSMEVISGKKQAEALVKQAARDYTGAEKDLEDVLGNRQEKIGLGSIPSIETMLYMGRLYAAQNKVEKATTIMKSAYDAKAKIIGGTSPALAELSFEIAGIFDKAKIKPEAEKYFRQALELAEKSWGKDKIETLPYIDALAKLLRANGEKQKAEVYEKEALDIRHPERASKLGVH
jgi:serine/threonine protein kinase